MVFFIALERIGGIMIYDVTDPRQPRFVDYVNSRDFAGSPVANTAADLGPEMSFVIPTSDSPIPGAAARGSKRSERHDRNLPDR